MAAAIPDGRLQLTPNVGHNPHFEAPDQLFPRLVDFLTSKDVGIRMAPN